MHKAVRVERVELETPGAMGCLLRKSVVNEWSHLRREAMCVAGITEVGYSSAPQLK